MRILLGLILLASPAMADVKLLTDKFPGVPAGTVLTLGDDGLYTDGNGFTAQPDYVSANPEIFGDPTAIVDMPATQAEAAATICPAGCVSDVGVKSAP